MLTRRMSRPGMGRWRRIKVCTTAPPEETLIARQSLARSQMESALIALNDDIAGRLDEVARILNEQGANRFRVQAYQRAATALRQLARPVSEIFAAGGLDGLEKLPGVGESIARSIRDILLHGKLAMLDRLRGEHDPIALLSSVPGIGKGLAWKLHDDLGLESLEDLESAAHDGRLESIAGLGAKRLAGIRDSLAHRLGRVRKQPIAWPTPIESVVPPVSELLDVDSEYRREASADRLKKIAPRRLNLVAKRGFRCCTPAEVNAITPCSFRIRSGRTD
jgi:ERCC4-type nuclease